MKISNVGNLTPGLINQHGPDNIGDELNAKLVFKKTLTSATKEQNEARLQELVGKIDEQGARLAKRADVKELEKYRSLIREFLDEVVSRGYEFSKENRFEARGRHRFFATVKTIDKKLDQLAKEVLSDQKDNIEIVNKIDDIRGLILDMML